jgi:lipopolysaccharide export system protein LptA
VKSVKSASQKLPSDSPDSGYSLVGRVIEIIKNITERIKLKIAMMPSYQMPQFPVRRLGLALMLPAVLFGAITLPGDLQTATAQTSQSQAKGQPLYINALKQEYDATTQVATARGNVQMSYPSRGIQATSAQAQYFSRERRIVFSGNVYILQKGGNSIRGEKVTYLLDEGRFIAEPKANQQVESIYMVNETNANNQTSSQAPNTAPLKRTN